MKSFKKRVGETLKRLRKMKGFASQSTFAEALQVDQSTVQRWESGSFLPQQEHVTKIEKVLGIKSLDKIFENPYLEPENYLIFPSGEIKKASEIMIKPSLERLSEQVIDHQLRLNSLESRILESEPNLHGVLSAWEDAEEWRRSIALFFLTGEASHLEKNLSEEFRRRLLEALRFHKMMPNAKTRAPKK